MKSNFNSTNKKQKEKKELEINENGKQSARKLLQSSDVQIKLEIQLQENETAILIIKGNEDPKISVDKFCQENNLDDEIKDCILEEVDKKIQENLNEILEEIDEEMHDGSDFSNNHKLENSHSKNLNVNNKIAERDKNSEKLNALKRNNFRINDEEHCKKKLENSMKSQSFTNEKIFYETNNINKNNHKNLIKRIRNDSGSQHSLSEEISISEEEKNNEVFSKNNNNNKKNKGRKENTSPNFFTKKERIYKYEDKLKSNKTSLKNNYENHDDEVKNECFNFNDKNSNRSRNKKNNYNRNGITNDIESHLSSGKNTYYTFNEQYIKKIDNKDNLMNSNNRNLNMKSSQNDKKFIPETYNSREIIKSISFKNKNSSNKKSIQRYQDSEEDNDNNKYEEYERAEIKKENISIKLRNKNEEKYADSRNYKSKNRNSNSNNSRSNSPAFIRKSIKYAAYGESFSISESEKKNSFKNSEENISNSEDSKYKYKKNKQAFVKEQVLYPDDSVEEEVGRIKDLREYKHSNLENVKKKNIKDYEYHNNHFQKKEISNSDLQNDIANEITKINEKRIINNFNLKESKRNLSNKSYSESENESSESKNIKAYYESNFNKKSLIGYEDSDSKKNNPGNNNLKSHTLRNKQSNHDYLNINTPSNLNLINNKIFSKKDKNINRKDWDNSKKLLYSLTSDKNKVEYSPPKSYSKSKSKSFSKSDEDHSRSNSENKYSIDPGKEEEIRKAKKTYKEKFLKNNNITDSNFIPGKRLYEQYQKKLPLKQEHHRKIIDTRLEDEVKDATFSPKLNSNSRRIFMTSQEKKRNKDNSYVSNENDNTLENSKIKNNSSSITNNNFSSFSNSNLNNLTNQNPKNQIRNKSYDKVEERLIDYGKLSKSRILRQKTKNSIQESNYSFHPKISEKTQIIASIKKKERLEKARSFIMNNPKDDLDFGENLANETDENVSNEYEEFCNNEKDVTYKNKNWNSRKNYNNTENYSSPDSLMNSEENFSLEKLNKYKNKENFSQNSGNSKKIKINSKNNCNTNRTLVSNKESENTFFNMRISPTKNKYGKKDPNQNKPPYNSTRNLNKNIKNKSIDKNFSKGKKISNNSNTINSKSIDKTSKYVPLNKNLSKKNNCKNNNIFPNDSCPNKNLRLEKENKYQQEVHISKTPNKQLQSSKSNVSILTNRKNTNLTSRERSFDKTNPSIHELLYTEADVISERRRKKIEEIENEIYPFKPKLNEKTKLLINRNETKSQFIARLMNSKKEAEEIIVQKKRGSELDKDSETGKPLFKPTISRGPLNPEKRKVTVDLDGYYDNFLLEKKKKVHEEEMLNNLQKKKHWLEKSMKSVLKMKIEKYKQIFDLLDSDKDGFISFKNIKLSEVNAEVLEALTPLFDELQKKGNYIDFKEFCIKADEMLASKIFGTANK